MITITIITVEILRPIKRFSYGTVINVGLVKT